MQNGFFDDLLKQESEMKEEKKEEVVAEEVVEETKTEAANDTEVFDFSQFSQKEETKQEEKVVEEEPKSNVEPPKEPTIKEEPKKVEKPSQEIKMENKPKMEEQPKPQNAVVKKDFNQALIENTLNKINDIVTYSNETFTPEAKIVACDIITSIDHTLNERGYAWNQIDAKGSGLIMQIKKWAKLGIDSSTDKLYADIRRNGNTGMYDIKVKGQYQTIEKLMVKYCRKPIIKFKTRVLCIGDKLETHENWATGEDKIIDFTQNNQIDRNDLKNITGAFKVAYIEQNDGSIIQVVTIIGKDRIMDAYNAATTKNVWNNYTQKMVLKTVTWEMFNGEDIRPFMNYPKELIEDLKIVNENEDIEFNKEHKYRDVVEADEHANETLGAGENVGFED